MNPNRVTIASFVILMAVASATAQKNQPQLRTVHGTVVDKQENPVSAAIVYVENKKTKFVRTALTDDRGLYRFSGLDPNVDFEIHAELNGMTSIIHTISTFDSRNDLDITLKLDKKKGEQ